MNKYTRKYTANNVTIDEFDGDYYECFKYVIDYISLATYEKSREEYEVWYYKAKDLDFYARGLNHIERQKFCRDWLKDAGYIK